MPSKSSMMKSKLSLSFKKKAGDRSSPGSTTTTTTPLQTINDGSPSSGADVIRSAPAALGGHKKAGTGSSSPRTTPQTSNRERKKIALPALIGPDDDDDDDKESNHEDDNVGVGETINTHNYSVNNGTEDEDSIMGYSVEGTDTDLQGAYSLSNRVDSLMNDSINDDEDESDDDYYKQDYFMMPDTSNLLMNDELSKSEQDLVALDNVDDATNNTSLPTAQNKRLNAVQMNDMLRPDTPHELVEGGNEEEGGDYADFYRDNSINSLGGNKKKKKKSVQNVQQQEYPNDEKKQSYNETQGELPPQPFSPPKNHSTSKENKWLAFPNTSPEKAIPSSSGETNEEEANTSSTSKLSWVNNAKSGLRKTNNSTTNTGGQLSWVNNARSGLKKSTNSSRGLVKKPWETTTDSQSSQSSLSVYKGSEHNSNNNSSPPWAKKATSTDNSENSIPPWVKKATSVDNSEISTPQPWVKKVKSEGDDSSSKKAGINNSPSSHGRVKSSSCVKNTQVEEMKEKLKRIRQRKEEESNNVSPLSLVNKPIPEDEQPNTTPMAEEEEEEEEVSNKPDDEPVEASVTESAIPSTETIRLNNTEDKSDGTPTSSTDKKERAAEEDVSATAAKDAPKSSTAPPFTESVIPSTETIRFNNTEDELEGMPTPSTDKKERAAEEDASATAAEEAPKSSTTASFTESAIPSTETILFNNTEDELEGTPTSSTDKKERALEEDVSAAAAEDAPKSSTAMSYAPQTPDNHNQMMGKLERFADRPISPMPLLEHPMTPASVRSNRSGDSTPTNSTTNMSKVSKENQRLRKRRKELLALLSSTAQQFSNYERVASQKITKLEQKNRTLLNPRENVDLQLATSTATSFSEEQLEEIIGENNSKAVNGSDNGQQQQTKMYDAAVVRRLSTGVLMQEKQINSKDELITQLKLRCEVLKEELSTKDSKTIENQKMWEEERKKLIKKLDSPSPVKQKHGELLAVKMDNARLKKDLEMALNDITNLTDALETNNETLNAAVEELDKLQEWKLQYGEAAAAAVEPPESPRITDAEKLRSEMKEKDEEISQLQNDLESSLNEVEELRVEMKGLAESRGFGDLPEVVEGLRNEVKVAKSDVEDANKRIAELNFDLESKKVDIEELRSSVEVNAAAAALRREAEVKNEQLNGISNNEKSSEKADTGGLDNVASALVGGEEAMSPQSDDQSMPSPTYSPGGGKRLFGRLGFGAGKRNSDLDEAADLPTQLRQRDLKIKSLEAMINSNSMIMEKLKLNIERLDNEKEETEYTANQKIERLTEENKSYEMQVAGFETAFMNLNEERGTHVTLKPLAQDDIDDVVESNNFMDDDDENDLNVVDAELKAKNSSLQRVVTELQSNASFQEDQIERLKAELIKLRVTSDHDKQTSLAQLTEENKIVKAQRSALENQLVEINKSAGILRESLAVSPSSVPTSPATPVESNDGMAGGDPVLVSQVVMLENANKVLESSCESLRSGMHEKLAPLLEKIALLEEERKMIEEEMNTKLDCREMTIKSLEQSLQAVQQASRTRHTKKKK